MSARGTLVRAARYPEIADEIESQYWELSRGNKLARCFASVAIAHSTMC